MAAASPLNIITFLLLFFTTFSESKLTTTYYAKTCPKLEQIVTEAVTTKQILTPTAAAGSLRVFIHDCFIHGCDASMPVSSNAFNQAERDSDINLSLSGDAFDLVTKIKTSLELQCPGVIYSADVLALATSDAVKMVGDNLGAEVGGGGGGEGFGQVDDLEAVDDGGGGFGAVLGVLEVGRIDLRTGSHGDGSWLI